MLTSTTPCPRLHQQPQKSGTTCWLQLRDSKMGMGQSFKTTNHVQPDPTSRSWDILGMFNCQPSDFWVQAQPILPDAKVLPALSDLAGLPDSSSRSAAKALTKPMNPALQLDRRFQRSSVPALQLSSSIQVLGFEFAKQTTNHSQTQSLRPNSHCCWEYVYVYIYIYAYVNLYIYSIYIYISYHIISYHIISYVGTWHM